VSDSSPQTRSYAPAACCYRYTRKRVPGRPLFEHKPEETPLLAHGVGWFVSLAFIGFVEFTLGSQLSALCCLSLTTVCSRDGLIARLVSSNKPDTDASKTYPGLFQIATRETVPGELHRSRKVPSGQFPISLRH